jgi:hypothetical protein
MSNKVLIEKLEAAKEKETNPSVREALQTKINLLVKHSIIKK